MKHKILNLVQDSNLWGTAKLSGLKKRPKYIDHLRAQSDEKQISVVVGVRRSGKSTILKMLLKDLVSTGVKPQNTLFLNFEDPRLQPYTDIDSLFEILDEFRELADDRSRKYLILDEVQNLPQWASFVRYLVDERKDIKVYMTSSSAGLLTGDFGGRLSGRYVKTVVYPLSYDEFRRFRSGTGSLLDFIDIGGFPDVVLAGDEVRDDLLRDYFESILVRDITGRYSIKSAHRLRRLAAFLYANNAKLISSYRLSKDLNISPDTIMRYFGYINDAMLGFFMPKFAFSLRKQEYNPKKFYTIDTGLQRAVSFRVLDNRGKNLENVVFLELKRRSKEVFYWTGENEVDFLVREGVRTTELINVSFDVNDASTLERELAGLREAMAEFNLPESTLLVYKGTPQIIDTDAGRVHVISVEDWLLG